MGAAPVMDMMEGEGVILTLNRAHTLLQTSFLIFVLWSVGETEKSLALKSVVCVCFGKGDAESRALLPGVPSALSGRPGTETRGPSVWAKQPSLRPGLEFSDFLGHVDKSHLCAETR